MNDLENNLNIKIFKLSEKIKIISKIKKYNKINGLLQQLMETSIKINNNYYIIEKQKYEKLNNQNIFLLNIIDNAKQMGKDYIEKINCLTHIQKTFNNIFDNADCIIYGSIIRQIFELPKSLSTFFDDYNYGNSINDEIDIHIYNNKPDIKNIQMISEKILEIHKIINLHQLLPDIVTPPKFGNYNLVHIEDKTIRVQSYNSIHDSSVIGNPYYKFHLNNINDKNNILIINIYGWTNYKNKSKNITHIENLCLSNNGIIFNNLFNINNNSTFVNIINDIINKEMITNIDLKSIHEIINKPIEKKDKCLELLKFIDFFINKIELIKCGYQLKSSIYEIPEYIIEKVEPCDITSINAPYIKFKLVCDHYISIMSFLGIINSEIEGTESIQCPYCRDQLNISFTVSLPSEIKIYKADIPYIISDFVPKIIRIESNIKSNIEKKIYSEEANQFFIDYEKIE